MATKRKVTKREYSQWVKWLKKQGFKEPFGELTPNHEYVKLLGKELKKDPPTILETCPRDPRTIASNLTRYGRGRKPNRTEVPKMTTLPEKYLIDHYQKLHKVLEQFYDQFRTPELSELCLFTLEGRITISHSYVSEMYIPAIIYEKGAVKFDVEDSFLWEYHKKHLVAEFPEFSQNLDDWKRSIATLVEECYDITKTIADQLDKTGWDSAEPYLDPASEDYGPGIFYHTLTDLIYKCLMADHVPEFQRVSVPHGLSILVMDYSKGRIGIARGESDLLDQVQQRCVDIASDDAAKNKVRKVLNIVGELDNEQELIKKRYEWYWREAGSKESVQSVLI